MCRLIFDHFVFQIPQSFLIQGHLPAKKSKEERAKPVSSYAEAGNIYILNKTWTMDLLDELESFKTEGIHDDQIDSLSLAFSELFKEEDRTPFIGELPMW